MARIFVTGATGLLGHAVLPLLQSAGHETRALVRNPDAAARWSGQGSVTPVRGDMLNVPAWEGALEGCDAVLHLAACYTGYVTGEAGEDTLMKTNVDATLRLAEAAERHAVGRMIFVSSAGVSRLGKAPIDESTAFDTGTDNAYFLSKIKAEQALDGFLAKAPRLSVVIARPSMMMGPDDPGPTPTGRFVRAYLRRELPVVLPGRAVIIDARDVAAAFLRMLDIGACRRALCPRRQRDRFSGPLCASGADQRHPDAGETAALLACPYGDDGAQDAWPRCARRAAGSAADAAADRA
jgi:dihydroflavonol-4-reductase